MQSGWRGWARQGLASALYHSRAIELLTASGNRHRLILAYHRVLARDSEELSFEQPGMYVTAETFEMHLRHLRRTFEVVPLDDLIDEKEERACAITFDDGWRDNYLTAFPILRAHQVPATVFLASNLVGTTRWPWPDRICFYIHRASLRTFSNAFESAVRAETGQSQTVALREPFSAADEAVRRLKQLEHGVLLRVLARMDERFAALASALQAHRPWLTWEEAREMSDNGVTFGSHTRNHVILTKVPLSEAQAEIRDSRAHISSVLGRPVTAFCYPNGEYNARLVQLVSEAGYRCAVTTRSGHVESSSAPFELGRILLHDDISRTLPMFTCALAGVAGVGQLWRIGVRRRR